VILHELYELCRESTSEELFVVLHQSVIVRPGLQEIQVTPLMVYPRDVVGRYPPSKLMVTVSECTGQDEHQRVTVETLVTVVDDVPHHPQIRPRNHHPTILYRDRLHQTATPTMKIIHSHLGEYIVRTLLTQTHEL
jgi:hypothetical protein